MSSEDTKLILEKLSVMESRLSRLESTQQNLLAFAVENRALLSEVVTKKEFLEFKDKNSSQHDSMTGELKRMSTERSMQHAWMERLEGDVELLKAA